LLVGLLPAQRHRVCRDDQRSGQRRDLRSPGAEHPGGAGPVGYGLREYTRTGVDGRFAIEEPEAGMFNVCYLPDSGVNLLKRCWRDERVGFYGQAIAVPESGVVDGIDTALAPGTSVAG
jgi:hypothetical protein